MSHEQDTKTLLLTEEGGESNVGTSADIRKENETNQPAREPEQESKKNKDALKEDDSVHLDNEKEEARKRRLQESKALLNKLTEVYPNIFPHPKNSRPVPLAIGLHKELQPIVKEWGFSAVTLRSALAWYTKQLRYQKAVLHSEYRINLDGTEGELVLESHKEVAKENIARIEAWLLKHKPNALAHKNPQKEGKRPKRKTLGRASGRGRAKSSAAHLSPKGEDLNSSLKETSQSLDDKMRSLLDKFNN